DYGEGDTAQIRAALAAATAADHSGAHRDTFAFVRAALVVADLGPRPTPAAVVAARAAVDQALAATRRAAPTRRLARIVRMLAGDRDGARAALEEAASGGGLVSADVALGNLALDGGDSDEALVAFARALARAPAQPRALVGRALASAERRGLALAARAD